MLSSSKSSTPQPTSSSGNASASIPPGPNASGPKLSRSIEMVTNVAILLVALLLGGMLVQRQFFPAWTPGRPALPEEIVVGTKLTVPGVTWSQAQKTLLIAVRPGCSYCTASAPFYRRLIEEAQGQARLLVVSGVTEDETKTYLRELDLPLDEVKQVPMEKVGVIGTPTLILVDRNGAVVDSWVGQLPPDQETKVLDRLKG